MAGARIQAPGGFYLSYGHHHVARGHIRLESAEDLLAEVERLTDDQAFYSLNLWERSPETQRRIDAARESALAGGEKHPVDGQRLAEDWVAAQGVQIDLDTLGHRLLTTDERQAINEAFS